VRGNVRAGAVIAACIGLVTVQLVRPAAAAAVTGDGEAPTYAPTEAWEAAVECGSCGIAVGEGTVYVHERDVPSGGRLRAIDLTTGDERWSAAAGRTGDLQITEYAVLLEDKERYTIYDPATGDLVAEDDGYAVEVNPYGILVAERNDSIVGVDVRTGETRWRLPTTELTVADVCRDLVVVVERGTTAPFRVLDQHTGEERWRSDDEFDHREDALTCGGWWIYIADGEHLTAYDTPTGFTFFQADAAGHELELYREMALVTLADGSGDVVAVDRLTGFVAWQRPLADIGSVVSATGRLRRGGADLLTVDTHSGNVVNRLSPLPGQALAVVALSETRVTVSSGSTVATYGLSDLGRAWDVDLGAVADEVAVGGEVLVARFGGRLVAFR
jgi:outer membrane protein assembly factor BamB